MKKALCLILAVFLTAGCGAQSIQDESPTDQTNDTAAEEPEEVQQEEETETEQEQTEMTMRMKIDDIQVEVEWQENDSVQALEEIASAELLSIQMSMYGGFEQVGPIGTVLPSADEQTVTDSGDIVLYSGDQLVVFYGSNSWAYTRLGHITDKTAEEMRELLGNGDVTITVYMEETK